MFLAANAVEFEGWGIEARRVLRQSPNSCSHRLWQVDYVEAVRETRDAGCNPFHGTPQIESRSVVFFSACVCRLSLLGDLALAPAPAFAPALALAPALSPEPRSPS